MHSLYTDLDSLFDTRLPIAYMLSPVETSYQVESGRYHNRNRDNIGNISADILKSFYRYRTKNILQMANPTPIFSLLMEQYGILRTKLETAEERDKLKIYVNTYPYVLSLEEQNVLLIKLCSIFETNNVELLHKSMSSLNDSWFYTNVGYIFMYNGLEWLEHETSSYSIMENPLVDKVLYIPAIVSGEVIDQKIDKSLFLKITETFILIIDINFVDTKYFSIGKTTKK